jgi:hypothetical protein
MTKDFQARIYKPEPGAGKGRGSVRADSSMVWSEVLARTFGPLVLTCRPPGALCPSQQALTPVNKFTGGREAGRGPRSPQAKIARAVGPQLLPRGSTGSGRARRRATRRDRGAPPGMTGRGGHRLPVWQQAKISKRFTRKTEPERRSRCCLLLSQLYSGVSRISRWEME